MSRVAVLGDFVVDLMTRSPYSPVLGETVEGSVFKMELGGRGFNRCVVTRKARAKVVMITKAGGDSFANVTLDTMTDLGMDEEHIFISNDKETEIVLIPVDEDISQNEIIIVPGACSTITDKEIKSTGNVIRESEYMLLRLEVNQDANKVVMDMANRYGCEVIVNTAPYSPVAGDFLFKAYMVTPSEVEAEELTGIPVLNLRSAKKAATYFYDKGVQRVFMTPGSRGVFVSSDGREEIVPAFKMNTVDTTGAGDAFDGGLLTALAKGRDIWKVMHFANGLAALSVQKLGTTPSMPSREEIDAFLQSTQ